MLVVARAAEQGRRIERMQQVRQVDKTYSAHLSQEFHREKAKAAQRSVATECKKWAAQQAKREAELQAEYDAAKAALGSGHAAADAMTGNLVDQSSRQYWSFVRAQEAEGARHRQAMQGVAIQQAKREGPTVDMLQRRRQAAEMENARARQVAQAGRAAIATEHRNRRQALKDRKQQERLAPQPASTGISTSTHLHMGERTTGIKSGIFALVNRGQQQQQSLDELAAQQVPPAETEEEKQERQGHKAAQAEAASARGRAAFARVRAEKIRRQAMEQFEDDERRTQARQRCEAMRSPTLRRQEQPLSPAPTGAAPIGSPQEPSASAATQASRAPVPIRFAATRRVHVAGGATTATAATAETADAGVRGARLSLSSSSASSSSPSLSDSGSEHHPGQQTGLSGWCSPTSLLVGAQQGGGGGVTTRSVSSAVSELSVSDLSELSVSDLSGDSNE